jgi:hypothetical protein
VTDESLADFEKIPLEFLNTVSQACHELNSGVCDCNIELSSHSSDAWITVHHPTRERPSQGWKLHISASVSTAEVVLRQSLSVLLRDDVDFKVVGSRQRLADLNDGRCGLSQIGKFITVYPAHDDQAVRLARALDVATVGSRGPAIPSDRPLSKRSLVHYRYGSFDSQWMRTPIGEIVSAIRAPDGALMPDRRHPGYSPPPWVHDPFIAAGVAALPGLEPQIGRRYLILATLYRSPRSTISLCLDLDVPRRCVVKRVREDGNNRVHRLRHEANILARLQPDPRFPTPYDFIEDDGDAWLVMEDLAGETLAQHVAARKVLSCLPPREEVLRWGRELAAILEVIHATGFIYGDLKPSNVIVSPDGGLRLLDFELCQARTEAQHTGFHSFGLGTQGYVSPQVISGHHPDVSDDVYSVGALLYFAATGADPSWAPKPSRLLERPIRLLNPTFDPALAQIIARCLDPDPSVRVATPAHITAALAAIPPSESARPVALAADLPDQQWAGAMARRIGDTLCALAKRTSQGTVVGWAESLADEGQFPSTDLNTGSAGAVIALAALVGAFGDAVPQATLAASARWLAQAPRPAGPPHPGLFVGEAGVGAAELRAGQVLGDQVLIATAAARGRWIATLPHASPDLFNGTAGRLRFHLWLWDATAESDHVRHAVAAGERLLATAEDVDGGGVHWSIPPGYDSLSQRAFLGYAHGAAGIGDALLDLFEVTGDRRFLAVAQGAGRWLERMALPALDDASGRNWPVDDRGARSAMAFWCHGAAGIGRFFLHLAALRALPSAMSLAQGAARVVALGTRWAGATQCHGLAGNIEYLLDMFQATGNRAYLLEARSLARLLQAFADDADGLVHWKTDGYVSNPGFTVGAAGLVLCWLRLAAPETTPHQFSRRGFTANRLSAPPAVRLGPAAIASHP